MVVCATMILRMVLLGVLHSCQRLTSYSRPFGLEVRSTVCRISFC